MTAQELLVQLFSEMHRFTEKPDHVVRWLALIEAVLVEENDGG